MSVEFAEQMREEDRAHAENLIRHAMQTGVNAGVTREQLKSIVYPSQPSNTGVAKCIEQHVKDTKQDLLVMGTRGLGTIKNTLMGMVGLGSVSEHVLHNLDIPVNIIHLPRDKAGAPVPETAAL